MRCDLTDEEDAALARLLSDTINDDRYLLLARIRLLKRILGRIRPKRSSPPLPRRSAIGKSMRPKKVAEGEFWKVDCVLEWNTARRCNPVAVSRSCFLAAPP
jgi:hypothetical protein